MRGISKVLAWSFLTLCAVTLLGETVNRIRIQFYPPTDDYFERDMNRRMAGYRVMDGRTLKCTSEPMRAEQGYEVTCQYFRGVEGQELIYRWYKQNGDYIGSLDGG